MSTGITSETNSVSSAASNTKTSSTTETAANDTPSSDGKDLLHSLKGHVSFARQCLGLLQNQMKHAMDTLDILQDQVTKAQSTIDKIERKENKLSSSQKVKSVVGNDYKASVDDVTQGASQIQGHRMIVIDGNGQPLYAIDKPGNSYGVPLQHQGGPCLCSTCTNGGQPVYIGGQDHTCTEKEHEIITVHPGQTVYPVDEKQAASLMSSCHDVSDEADGETKAASSTDTHICQKKRKCSCSPYVADSPKSDADERCPHSPPSNNGPNTTSKVLSDSSKSTSPIASQLLQVIDVLQNAGDDEGKDIETCSPFTRSFRCENTHCSTMPFTGPVPHPVYTASGAGIITASGRRTRKQDMSPIKKENQARPQDTQYSTRDIERELPELMKVPPPVLAATLEPDFLVVPGNSYFADSPPSTGSAAAQEKEKLITTRDNKRQYERHTSRESQSSDYESAITPFADVKKERVEKRSSSVSSMSQASDGSRSPSESSISERSTIRCLDDSTGSDKTDRILRTTSHEITVRDKQREHNVVYSSNSLHKQPNGDSSEIRVSSVESASSSSTSTRHSRPSLLNSAVTDGDIPNQQLSPLSPKSRSSARTHKVTPLNSITTSGLTEIRRNASVEYMSNPGIVRISHATPMTSAVPSTLSNQSKTDTSRFTSKASSNDKLTSSMNSFAHNSGSETDLSLVTTYSVAQIGNEEASSSPCTSPSKRPNILSRNRQGKKDIPQGIVVLVPTIEDAKQLIKSSGGNQGNTPVLVPQNVLNQFSTNGEAPKSSADSHLASALPGKRQHFPESNAAHSRPKRRLNEPLVID